MWKIYIVKNVKWNWTNRFGNITIRNGVKVGFLQQIPKLQQDNNIYEQIYYSDQKSFILLREYYRISGLLEKESSEELDKKYREIMTKLDAIDGWKIEVRAPMTKWLIMH